VRKLRPPGSVRGALSNERPYRDVILFKREYRSLSEHLIWQTVHVYGARAIPMTVTLKIQKVGHSLALIVP
jgi:hypothetical protein